jgi:peptide deformylase
MYLLEVEGMNLVKGNDPVLHSVAAEVPKNTNMSLLIHAMWTVMYKNKGIGLAAPQLGESKRVIVMDAGGLKIAIINPVITARKLGKVKSIEGCLSYPGEKVTVSRDKMVVVEGFDQYWKPLKFKLRGIAAMCVQHEIDHLNGVTI